MVNLLGEKDTVIGQKKPSNENFHSVVSVSSDEASQIPSKYDNYDVDNTISARVRHHKRQVLCLKTFTCCIKFVPCT